MNTNGKHKIIPAAYLILIKDGRTLLARRCNTGFEDGNYGLVAGHIEERESAKQALQREVKEEAGIDINLSDIEIAHIMHRKCADGERVDFFFTTDKYLDEPQNMEPDKCDDMQWFPLDNLPENTINFARFAIENYQKGIFYSEFGW